MSTKEFTEADIPLGSANAVHFFTSSVASSIGLLSSGDTLLLTYFRSYMLNK